jgi:di/tricarboxylate transporter
MALEAWLTIAVILGVLSALMFTKVGADLVMLAGLAVLLTLDALSDQVSIFGSPADALAGFANEGTITVGVLFVVAAAIRETGGLSTIAARILNRPKSLSAAQTRMMAPTAVMSAVMNNTPLVAMMLPIISDWAKKIRVSPSKLLMPLSFAAILGGLCTLIGTSTNLVVHGLLISYQRSHALPDTGLGMFDITLVGVPCAIAGIVYILVLSRWLLPDRIPPVSLESDPREYTVEMQVEPGSPLVGKSIEDAGLRQLVGMYLMEIERDGEVIPMVGPEQKMEANDRLVFVGIVDSVVELQRIRGLRPATSQVFKLNEPRPYRCLIEAVVSNTCRLVGQTIRDGRFRAVYNAVVIAVARNGERIRKKIGDIVIKPGDTLLLEASPAFADAHRNSRDFYLVSKVEDSHPPRHERAWIAIAILGLMVLLAATEVLSMMNAALLAAGAMVLTRCINATNARRAVDLQVLLMIGAALGLGKAMETSGAAQAIVDQFIGLAGDSPMLALIVIYLLTMLFTEAMSNNGAAALMFPIAMTTSATLDVSAMPYLIAVMIAASCGFATPIGYQTNLMVYGPGGYRFSDYMRFGGGLNLVVFAVTMIFAPLVWPF